MGSSKKPAKAKWKIMNAWSIIATLKAVTGSRTDSKTTYTVVDAKHCIPRHQPAWKAIQGALHLLRSDCPEFFKYRPDAADCDDRQVIMNGELRKIALSKKAPWSFAYGWIHGAPGLYPGIDEPHAALWGLTDKGFYVLEPANGKVYKLGKSGGKIWKIYLG